MSANFLQITPVVAVPDLDGAVAFFRDRLGFAVVIEGGGYAYVEREGVGCRLMDRSITGPVPAGNRRFGIYIDVRDVDAVHAELSPRLADLPAGDAHGPADKPYGQRELCIVGPDGNLVVFGQALG